MTYTCPMHPEVISDKPGNCPKCQMALVLKTDKETEKSSWRSYELLLIVLGLILLTTFVFSYRDFQNSSFALPKAISYFMSGFFLVFAGFKLIDLKGFANGYRTYDLLAQKVPA